MIFTKNFEEIFDEKFADEASIVEEGRRIALSLTEDPFKSFLAEDGFDSSNPTLLYAFNKSNKISVFNEDYNEERIFSVIETGYDVYEKPEGALLHSLEKCLVRNEETGEEGIALYEYSALTGLVSLKYESYFEDGTLATKIYSCSDDISAIVPEYYEKCFFDAGVYYTYRNKKDENTVSIAEQHRATGFEPTYATYDFEKGTITFVEDGVDYEDELPEGFGPDNVPDKDFWNFDSEILNM